MTKWTLAILMVCGFLFAAGCSSSPRANFYNLTATAAPDATASQRQAPSLAVDAITLPEFVDRPQFVIISGENRVEILEMQQWAESLKNAIPRILADNLSRQLRLDRVAAYPQQAGNNADYHLAVDFQRFEATATSVSIDAIWTLRSTGSTPLTGRSRVRETRTDSYESVASAYSRALATVSGDIARSMFKELRP